jgi:hypothetical protein
MNPGIPMGMFGSFIACIWAFSYLLGVVLPEKWLLEWYGLPTVMTVAFSCLSVSLLGGIAGGMLWDRWIDTTAKRG